MNQDGSEQRRLTTDAAEDSTQAWSPDGRWIAFQSDRDAEDRIHVMRADGSAVQRLTHGPIVDAYPAGPPVE
jgi:TolB protein